MSSQSYSELLKDPRWQKMRLLKLEESKWSCESCNSKEKTLHVHHKLYRRGAAPREYDPSELEVLCEECHETIHMMRTEISTGLGELPAAMVKLVFGYVQSLRSWLNGRLKVDASDWQVARGVSDAIGKFSVWPVDEIGGYEWVQEQSKSAGGVVPKELNDRLWSLWVAASQKVDDERRAQKKQS